MTTQLAPFAPLEFCQMMCPYLPSDLTPRANIDRVLKFVELLPTSIWSRYLIFECSLSKSSLDLSFHLDISTDEKKSLLADCFQYDSLSTTLKKDASWKRFCVLIEKFVAEQSFFEKSGVTALGLEFDVGSSDDWPPAPNIFFLHLDSRDVVRTGLDFFSDKLAVEQVAAILTHAEMYDLKLTTTGFMTARRSERVKLAFRAPHLPDVLELFLQKISYSYPVSSLVQLIKKIRPLVGDIDLQIDVTDAIHAKIGIECNPPSSSLAHKWAPFLEVLVQEKLITEKQASSLLCWPGGTAYFIDGEEHPFIRYFYFKIVYEPGKPIDIKAYPCVFHYDKDCKKNTASVTSKY